MSSDNACTAITTWASAAGLDPATRDLSPFITAAILVGSADGPLDDTDRALLSALQQALTGNALTDEGLQSELDWIANNGDHGAVTTIRDQITDQQERGLAVTFAALTACAERGVTADEGAMLQKLGQGLGFSHEQVLQYLGKAMKGAAGHY